MRPIAFYPNANAEADALRRAALRVGCTVRNLEIQRTQFGVRAVGNVTCADGWVAAAFLTALAEEDAQTPGARDLALSIRRRARSDEAFARAVHAYVKKNVAFVREHGEVFQNGSYTLESGAGDCDDHGRLVYALARAGGIPAEMAFLHKGDGPTHAVAKLCPDGACAWAETTVDAAYSEHPLAAAKRLNLISERDDLATKVRTMSEKDLPPPPPHYAAHNPAEAVRHDAASLAALGYLDRDAAAEICDPADPVFRSAVLAFQLARGLTADALTGPQTRGALAEAMAGLAGADESTRIEPVHSARLPDSFLRKVAAMAQRLRDKGADITGQNLLSVWLYESGIRAHIPNGGGAPYYGLNQMGVAELKQVGFPGGPLEWMALTEEQQLPYIERFIEIDMKAFAKDNYALLSSPTALYLLNFLPAYIGHAGEPDFVLVDSKNDPYGRYKANRGFDADNKGTIVVSDLTKAIARGQQGAGEFWIELRKRMIALEGDPDSGKVDVAKGIAALALIIATGAVAVWQSATG